MMKLFVLSSFLVVCACGSVTVVDETGLLPDGFVERVIGHTVDAAPEQDRAAIADKIRGATLRVVAEKFRCEASMTWGCFDPNTSTLRVMWQPNCYSIYPTPATIAHELGHLIGHDHDYAIWFGSEDPNDDDFGLVVETVWAAECFAN